MRVVCGLFWATIQTGFYVVWNPCLLSAGPDGRGREQRYGFAPVKKLGGSDFQIVMSDNKESNQDRVLGLVLLPLRLLLLTTLTVDGESGVGRALGAAALLSVGHVCFNAMACSVLVLEKRGDGEHEEYENERRKKKIKAN